MPEAIDSITERAANNRLERARLLDEFRVLGVNSGIHWWRQVSRAAGVTRPSELSTQTLRVLLAFAE